MNIMNHYAWHAMWRSRTRTLVTIAGILLSAAMFTAVATLGVSLLQYVIDMTVYMDGDYFVGFDHVLAEDLTEIESWEEVSQVGTASTLGYTTFYTVRDGSEISQTCIVAAGDEAFYRMKTVHLTQGRLPENGREVVIPENVRAYLESAGSPCAIGDVLEVEIVPEFTGEEDYELPKVSGRAFTGTFRIVGIAEDDSSRLVSWSTQPMNLLTFDDGTMEQVLWSRCYVKTHDPRDAYVLGDRMWPWSAVNTKLLSFYGASRYTNINQILYAVCGVLMAIVLVGSVSLIYNAISISLSERTRDFGLLISIGATKKQLRRSIYFEALALSAIGVPLGIACGYFGIAVTLYLTNDLITGLLVGSIESGITFDAVASLPAFGCAGAVAVLTVLISARIPVRRALKVDPIGAIRQTMDYQVPKKPIRAGRLAAKVFGVPGLMASKYYHVSRKKYRSTVISLTISVVLFLTSVSFGNCIRGVADNNTNNYNYDLEVYNITPEEAELIRSRADVDRSALINQYQYTAILDPESFSGNYTQAVADGGGEMEAADGMDGVRYINCYFLEDQVFRSYCDGQGIDPEPYFNPEGYAALICDAKITVYHYGGETTERIVYESPVFQRFGVELKLFQTVLPQALLDLLDGISNGFVYDLGSWQGWPMMIFHLDQVTDPEILAANPGLQSDGTLRVVQIQEEGVRVLRILDPETDTLLPEPEFSFAASMETPALTLLDRAKELPFGISNHSNAELLSIVLPLSRYFGPVSNPCLALTVKDYDSLTAWLDEMDFDYADLLGSQIQYRNLVTMINVFTYGFIILISLICVCNVFNTISTNIALRRRDFGMLRSVGMKSGELDRMMALECARYGVNALLLGLPIGLGLGYGIWAVVLDLSGSVEYTIPLGAVLAAVMCVFAVVFITMVYAMSRLRKDDPITAIRMDNL